MVITILLAARERSVDCTNMALRLQSNTRQIGMAALRPQNNAHDLIIPISNLSDF